MAETASGADAPPELNIPDSTSTVTVRVIEPGSVLHLDPNLLLEPGYKRFNDFKCPSYVFLVSNKTQEKHILFDLGLRKDWENMAPGAVARVHRLKARIDPGSSASEVLDEENSGVEVHTKDISAIIWSHYHWDHTGDPTAFPNSTELIVGPGFKEHMLPGYPPNFESTIRADAWKDRELKELEFKGDLKIGRFRALDYFGDGSFYLLDTPGHCIGNLAALARVTSSPDTFVLMGGDTAHHAAEIRPSKWLPLPEKAKRNIREDRGRTAPYLRQREHFPHNYEQAEDTLVGVQEFDAHETIFVVLAHDRHIKDIIDLFPDPLNAWKEKGFDEDSRWKFLEDIEVS